MEAIRVKAKALFRLAEDGIHAVPLVPGQVVCAPAHLVPGLIAADLVEETTEELTTPEKAGELHAAYADPHVEAGITPWQGVRTGQQEPTLVEDEHLEPIRRRAKERAARKGVAAVAEPTNPPPVDDRRTPPHPLGSVIDADDRAARDSAVDAARRGLPAGGTLAPEATEAAQVTGKTLDEVLAGPGRTPSASDKAKTLADERGKPADVTDDKGDKGGPDYATKDEKAVGRKRDRQV